MCSWRSTRLPHGFFESLKWNAFRRRIPRFFQTAGTSPRSRLRSRCRSRPRSDGRYPGSTPTRRVPAKTLDDLREMLEPVAQVRALAGRVFKQHPRLCVRTGCEDFAETFGDQAKAAALRFQRCTTRDASRGRRGPVTRRDPVRRRSASIDPRGARVGGGEIDQIAVVRDDRSDLRLPHATAEQRDFLGRKFARAPLAGGLR